MFKIIYIRNKTGEKCFLKTERISFFKADLLLAKEYNVKIIGVSKVK